MVGESFMLFRSLDNACASKKPQSILFYASKVAPRFLSSTPLQSGKLLIPSRQHFSEKSFFLQQNEGRGKYYMKLSLELNKKYSGPTNRAFEHGEVLSNNIDHFVNAQNVNIRTCNKCM